MKIENAWMLLPGRKVGYGTIEIADGVIRDVALARPPDDGGAAPAALVLPGLVNCHGHTAMTLTRGLGGGLPIGATYFGEKTKDTLSAGTHGSTFGGNPVVCAGAYSVMSRIDDELLADVEKKSKYIFDKSMYSTGQDNLIKPLLPKHFFFCFVDYPFYIRKCSYNYILNFFYKSSP